MTFHDFVRVVGDTFWRKERWRRGQTYFNVLAEERPDLSERIRGSALDPFYDDSRLDSFLPWVAEHWQHV